MTTWTRAALIRAAKTVAQTAVALLTTGAVGILDVDWIAVLSASTLAGIVSILTSVAGLPETEPAAVVETSDGGFSTGVLPASEISGSPIPAGTLTVGTIPSPAAQPERLDPATVPDPDTLPDEPDVTEPTHE